MGGRGARRAGGADVREQRGQASVLLVGGLCALLVGVVVLAAVARGVAREGSAQRAVDLAALSGARAMQEAFVRLFEPAEIDGRPNPLHLEVPDYLALGRAAADATARRNGAAGARVSFPDGDSFAPVRVRVTLAAEPALVRAEAELAPPGGPGALAGGPGAYDGPLAYRQGKPMRPDVAQAFDRMAAAASADGVRLVVVSAFRTDAEQAILWRRHPDPKWVAPPGTSLHRYATELDLGPRSAYPWLAANAERFHFLQRYSHEPWHYGVRLSYSPSHDDSCRDRPCEPRRRPQRR